MPLNTPTITSNGGLDTASITINEGVTAVTTVTATDGAFDGGGNFVPDGDTLTYSIIGGADRFKFRIDSATGALTFINAPDFEKPSDTSLNGSNTYEVVVRVSDGDLIDTQTIVVTIADVAPKTINGTSGDDAAGFGAPTVEGDTINGLGGNDVIDGGAGLDIMAGGLGNDTYYVNDRVVISGVAQTDTVTENAGEGTDTVISTVAAYTLAANVENLTLGGTESIDGTGNSGDNTITGNAGSNELDGGGGTDTMIGGLGSDIYYTDGGDTITENVGEGTDLVVATVAAGVTFTLGSNLENLTLGGTAASNGTGNELNNTIDGNSAANTLTGGAGNDKLDGLGGADSMNGGLGSDTYYVDNAGDSVSESGGDGVDTVNSSVAFSLGSGLENLVLTGTSAINGDGNNLANKLTGNSAANTLEGEGGADVIDGKAGNDTLIGGAGSDKYYVDSLSDTVTELANEGSDSVIANVSGYTLGANVENLTLGGSFAVGNGNALDNKINGNSANNTLNGGDGNDKLDGLIGVDTMVGGLGDDIYYVGTAGETVTEVAGEGTDLVRSSVTITSLAANVENLQLTGLSKIDGTGNSLDNEITGNVQDNVLTGLGGNDTLKGGRGIDTMVGGLGNDTYFVAESRTVSGVTTIDTVTEAAGEGTDTVISTLDGYTLAANVENLTLGGIADIDGSGNGDANTITGNKGWNVLNGGGGADTINGAQGADTINGGAGQDALTGGTDADTFVWSLVTDSGNTSGTADTISDFSLTDVIDLRALDARGDLSGDQAFVLDTNGTLVQGEVLMTRSGNVITLSVDTDSTAGANMMIMITVDSTIPSGVLTADNFLL